VRIDRLVYATVVLMSVLVVYDGWQQLASFAGLAAVIIAPMLALGIAHLFAEVLHAIAELRRPLTAPEWAHFAREQVSWFLAALPPLVVLGIGWVSPMDALTTISLLIWTGLLTLIALAAVAGHRAGLRGWRWVGSALSGGVIGLIVISLQVVLKPH
jgi:hypothetical protein